jgi:ubiquinol-cytochrome c reductase cytochrome c1 subunit
MTTYRTIAAVAFVGVLIAQTAAIAADGHHALPPPRLQWSFAGPFGTFDQGQLQRGFKIYKEVCASCHSLTLVAIHTLANPGGPGFSAAQVAALAAEYRIKDLDDRGEPIERAGRRA